MPGNHVGFLRRVSAIRPAEGGKVEVDLAAVRARKRLAPTDTGYQETLQVDFGDGEFVDWSVILLERN